MPERLRIFALAILVAQLPFELRFTVFGLTNLQWTFVLLVVVSFTTLLINFRRLADDRLVQACLLFVALQWLAALYCPEFHLNAVKAATRYSAGFLLLVNMRITEAKWIRPIWWFAAVAAALYALTVYAGLGTGWLFRTEEFFIGPIQRLSGSFEYPNTAAAYFAMSLPLVWFSAIRSFAKGAIALLLWSTLVLTLSRGAFASVFLVVLAAALLSKARTVRWLPALGLLSIGVVAYVLLLPLNPCLVERIKGPVMNNPFGARYETPWNYLQERPAVSDHVLLHVTNTGIATWPASGWRRIAVGTRWWSVETQKFLKMRPVITNLSHDIQPGETAELPILFETPTPPGSYVLVVELFSGDLHWFSQTRIQPSLIHAEIADSVPRIEGQVDLSSLYGQGQTRLFNSSVPRSVLWSAAVQMVREHPFGIGPDNFRLEYGKYLGASKWDQNIYSNNLYLEILTGSGIPGLIAFGLVIAAIRWRTESACLAVAVFLVHGLVDVFIMATPIYFAFWILIGLTGRSSEIGPQTASPVLH